MISRDGTGLETVGADAHGFSQPAWLDGKRIVYASGRECLRWGLYVAMVVAGPQPRITNACRFTGTARGDVLRGTPFLDYLKGLGGDDVLRGARGNDTLTGGPGPTCSRAERAPIRSSQETADGTSFAAARGRTRRGWIAASTALAESSNSFPSRRALRQNGRS